MGNEISNRGERAMRNVKQSKELRCGFSWRQALTFCLDDKISQWSMFDAAEGSHKKERGCEKEEQVKQPWLKEQEDVRRGKE